MLKKVLLVTSVFTFILMGGVVLYSQQNWNLEFDKEGIKVFTRPVEGSPLNEFKGEGLVDAPIEVCKKVNDDIASYTKWRPGCISSKILKTEGGTVYLYTQTKAPWPVSNRDVIVKSVVTETKDKVEYKFSGVNMPELMPVQDGVVRMVKVTGYWLFERKGNQTMVTYQAKIDPAGSIPSWLANKTSKDQPFKSLLGMREMVKDGKYK